MTRARIVLLSAGVFIGGVLCGGLAVGWFASEFLLASSLRNSAALAALVETSALESIRAGDSDKAASTLEASLDGNLITLHALLESHPDASFGKTLQRVANYRAEHPRPSTDQVGAAEISAMLSKYRNSHESAK